MQRSAPLRRRATVRERTKEVPRTVFPKHQRFVRGFVCVAYEKDGANCSGRPQFCHVRRGTHAGTSQKPPDWFGYPACAYHHLGDQHQHGEATFEAKYDVNLRKIALRLAEMMAAKDPEFRAAMQEHRGREPWLFEA